MKNHNVQLLQVLCCLLCAGNAFANIKTTPSPQVTTFYTINGNHATLTKSLYSPGCIRFDPLGRPDRSEPVLQANGQQEVDPAWFDPWAPDKVAAPAAKRRVAAGTNHRKTDSAPSGQRKIPVRQVKAGSRDTSLAKR